MHHIMLNCPLAYLFGVVCACGKIAHFWSLSPMVRGALEGVFYAPRLSINELHALSRHRGALWAERGA